MQAVSTPSTPRRGKTTLRRILVYASPRQEAPALLEQALPLLQPRETSIRLIELPDAPHTPHAPRTEPFARVAESLARLDVSLDRVQSRSTDAMLKEAVDGRYDLVIKGVALGEYGRRKLDAIDQQLVERCPAPVWLLEWAAPRPLRRVLAALNPGEPEGDHDRDEIRRRELAVRVAAMAGLFAQATGAELHVLHAWTVFGDHLLRGVLSSERFESYVREARSDAERSVRESLALASLDPEQAAVHLTKGRFEQVVPAFITDFDVDLLVLGTRGRTGWLSPVVQPHAELVLGNTHASVLVLKAFGGEPGP